MMPCDHTQLVAAFYDGELAPDQAREMAIHIESCPVCLQELRSLQRLSQSIAAAPLGQPSGITLARLASARRRQERGIRRLAGALTAAAVVLLAVSVWNNQRAADLSSPLVGLDVVVVAAADEEPPPQTLAVARWMASDLALASAGGRP